MQIKKPIVQIQSIKQRGQKKMWNTNNKHVFFHQKFIQNSIPKLIQCYLFSGIRIGKKTVFMNQYMNLCSSIIVLSGCKSFIYYVQIISTTQTDLGSNSMIIRWIFTPYSSHDAGATVIEMLVVSIIFNTEYQECKFFIVVSLCPTLAKLFSLFCL